MTRGEADLTAFFMPGDIASAFRDSHWSEREMVRILAEIARDPHLKPKDRMAASDRLLKLAEKSLTVTGAMRRTVASMEVDMGEGRKAQIHETAESLGERRNRTLDMLQAAQASQELIDMENATDDGRSTDDSSGATEL